MTAGLPGARTFTVRRPVADTATGRTRDRVGDKRPTALHQIDECVFVPAGSSETNDRGLTVTSAAELLGPYDADLGSDDEVDIDGAWWHVQGLPERWANPHTGEEIGMRARLLRVTG